MSGNVSEKVVHFTCHAQSVNCDITDEGEHQSKLLNGKYDLVIISDLFPTRRTLELSNVKFSNLAVTDLCHEKEETETEDDTRKRVEEFKTYLEESKKLYDRILVISHSVFGWYLTGKCLKNCEILSL